MKRGIEKYRPGLHVRYAWVDDRVVILDLLSESYYALDPTASSMWQQLALGQDREESLRNLGQRYAGDDDGLAEEFDAFAERCVTNGLLTAEETAAPPRTRVLSDSGQGWGFLTLRAWWSLFRTTRSLSKRGFFPTYSAALHMPTPAEVKSNTSEKLLAKALRAFARAENFFYLKKAPRDCLPRSLALFRFLISVGLPAQHCIGVQQFPFAAHAWTEYGGQVVYDDPANQEKYTLIATIPA